MVVGERSGARRRCAAMGPCREARTARRAQRGAAEMRAAGARGAKRCARGARACAHCDDDDDALAARDDALTHATHRTLLHYDIIIMTYLFMTDDY